MGLIDFAAQVATTGATIDANSQSMVSGYLDSFERAIVHREQFRVSGNIEGLEWEVANIESLRRVILMMVIRCTPR